MIGFSEDDALAAEYALGTLDDRERAEATARRSRDPIFDAAVRDWEVRLAPLLERVDDVTPSLAVRRAVLDRITAGLDPFTDLRSAGSTETTVVGMKRQIRLWRGATAIAGALAASLALWILKANHEPNPKAAHSYLAVLQEGTSAASFIVALDLDQRRMTVVPSAARQQDGKSYELWMIGAEAGKPVSLGLIDAQEAVHPRLPPEDLGVISKATYAVTIEPVGGSPNGQPTSAPVFVGHLIDAPS